MCLMHTDLPGPRRAEDHRDHPVGDAEVEAVQHRVAPEALDDVDELDGVLAAVVADVPWYSNFLVGRLALADALPQIDLFAGLSAHSPLALSSATSYTSLLIRRSRQPMLAAAQPPIGALGFAPQKIWEPIIPIRCTSTMFRIIDLAVAWPTPTGPPEAV